MPIEPLYGPYSPYGADSAKELERKINGNFQQMYAFTPGSSPGYTAVRLPGVGGAAGDSPRALQQKINAMLYELAGLRGAASASVVPVVTDPRYPLNGGMRQAVLHALYLQQLAGAGPEVTALLMSSRYNVPGFNGYSGSDGTDTDNNSRISGYNETGATVTKLRAYYVNWMANATNEQNGYNAITVAAAVEYPAGTFTPLTFAGAGSTSVPASGAGSLVESDEATLTTPIPANAQYWVRTYVSVVAGGKWVQNYLINTGFGEAADFATGVNKTASGTITNGTPSATRRGYGPLGVKATAFTGTPVAKAFAAVGDSLIMGSTDALDNAPAGRGPIGYFAKACVGNYPVVNLGIAGTSAANNLPANFTRRAAALAKLGVTHVFCDWSVNDIIAGRTGSQLAGDVASIAAGFKAAVAGVKVVWATLTPRTSSTDSWKTVVNQTAFATPTGAFTGGAASNRSQFNAALRAGVSGVDMVFEAADSVETARDSGLWRAGEGSTHLTNTGATSDAATSDGLHPTAFSTTAPGLGGIYVLRDSVRAVFAGW